MKATLTDLTNIVAANGAGGFQGPHAILWRYPILATLGLSLYNENPDRPFLERIHGTATAYINYLLVNHDQDGDFLMERTTWNNGTGRIEDVGFNALFAIDMMSLSRICIELGKPIDALFWYQGGRTVAQQLVRASLDSDGKFFFPTDNDQGRKPDSYYALSALPALFEGEIGHNLAEHIVRETVLAEHTPGPETPLDFLDWSRGGDPGSAEFRLKGAMLLRVLESAGFTPWAQQFRQSMVQRLAGGANRAGTRMDAAYAQYFGCLIAGSQDRSIFATDFPLTLFEHLCRRDGVVDAQHRLSLAKSAPVVHALLSAEDDADVDVSDGSVEQSIRDVYFVISETRRRAENKSLFGMRDRSQIPGFDIYAAFDLLVDDVVRVLQRAETSRSRRLARQKGLTVDARVIDDTSTAGTPIRMEVELVPTTPSVDVHSVVVQANQVADTLHGGTTPLKLTLGGDPVRLPFDYRPPATGDASLVVAQFSVDVQMVGGARYRYHFRKGVFLTRQVTFDVTFPRGKTLSKRSLPIIVNIEKHATGPSSVQAEWHSPAGLNLERGRNAELILANEPTSASMNLSVAVPPNVRPGRFPFTLRLFINGAAAGTVTSDLFKHYEWLFVGPFASTGSALTTEYPPERSVSLRETYPGKSGRVSWMLLSSAALKDNGNIDLTPSLPDGSVAYLYTVVKSATSQKTPVFFASTAPAILFINGEKAVVLDNKALGTMNQVDARLKRGANSVLVKVLSGRQETIYFQMGNEDVMATDDLNNNLAELIDGYKDVYAQPNSPPEDGKRVVTLIYRDSQAQSVSVIGSFNGWSSSNSQMRLTQSGTWEISLHLDPGRYAYRFLVDGSQQILDPTCAVHEPDGYGGRNSVLFVR